MPRFIKSREERSDLHNGWARSDCLEGAKV